VVHRLQKLLGSDSRCGTYPGWYYGLCYLVYLNLGSIQRKRRISSSFLEAKSTKPVHMESFPRKQSNAGG